MSLLRVTKKLFLLLNRKQKIQFICIVLMMIIGALLEMASVALMGILMSVIMESDSQESNQYYIILKQVLGIETYSSLVILICTGLIGIYLFKNVFLLLEYYVQNRFVFKKRYDIQSKLVQSYLLKPYEYFLSSSENEILQVVNEDINNSFQLFITVLNVYTEIATALLLGSTLLVTSFAITALVIGVLLMVMLAVIIGVKPILNKAAKDKINFWSGQNKWLMQALEGIKEIKIAKNENFFLKKFKENSRQYIAAEERNVLWQNIPRLLIEGFGISAVVFFLIVYIKSGNNIMKLIPVLAVFVAAAFRLLPCFNRMAGCLNIITFQEPFLTHLLSNLEKVCGESQKDDSKLVDFDIKKEICLKNICYHYPDSTSNILENVSITIPVGASVGIVGESGAGKTTAVDILLGLLKPQRGAVLVDGKDIKNAYLDWLSCVAYIPQTIFMLNDTIRNNIVFGRNGDNCSDDDIWLALKEAKLENFVKQLPNGIDTEIGERGVRISGGQRQRIGIARALFTRASLLVFDEATSALDNETESAIMDAINELHGKKTLIIIAHRLQTIKGCDMVLSVENGNIIQR